ncbi:hypothetical protein TNCV_2410671 [Trichonephila clavipes]|nr:hypothetical protein TNCV_2410671 [Trichonephila clavipes]
MKKRVFLALSSMVSINPRAVSLPGTPKRGTTSRSTRAGSLLPPVYSEAWAKENAEVCGLDGKRRKGEKWDDKMRVGNKELSLGYPGVMTPVFTKESKPLGKIGKDH